MMTPPDESTPVANSGSDVSRSAGAVADAEAQHRRRRHAQRAIIVAVAFGGIFGALLRYWLSMMFPTVTGQFPWITFVINVSGSAVLGFLLILLTEQFPRGRLTRPVIGTGFCGAYTTFSTYTVEALLLVRDHRSMTAAVYVLASLVAGLLAVWLGITIARVTVRAEHWLQRQTS